MLHAVSRGMVRSEQGQQYCCRHSSLQGTADPVYIVVPRGTRWIEFILRKQIPTKNLWRS